VANFFHHGPEPTFADSYRAMSELELYDLAADWHGLVPEARSALAAEFASRGLGFIEPPPVADSTPEFRNLVTIRKYRDLSEAIVARAVVESSGIFCFLKDENFARLEWQISNFIGGIRLQVDEADVEATEAILSQPIVDSISIPDQPEFEQPRCPRCSSMAISWERQGRKVALASLYLLSLPLPRGSESWTCNACGLRWVEEDDPTPTASEDDSANSQS
jgi:hypothetical protein